MSKISKFYRFRESEILKALKKAEMESWLTTDCEQEGTMSPQLYHGSYEASNYHLGQGAWCGRYSYGINNNDIWNTNMGKKFDTGTYNDVCFGAVFL